MGERVRERHTCERDSPNATMHAVASSSTERRMGPTEQCKGYDIAESVHSTLKRVHVSEPGVLSQDGYR